VLKLDQLPAAGFVADTAPQAVAASMLSSDTSVVAGLGRDGLQGVATAHYVRPQPELATANGPLDVVATVATFASAAGAHTAMGVLAGAADSRPGAGAVSAGDLGAESHAVTETATAPDGTRVVQVTVIWRVANVLNEMAVRGRLGGTGVGDAVVIAHRQADAER
jgi:hypothetical protein